MNRKQGTVKQVIEQLFCRQAYTNVRMLKLFVMACHSLWAKPGLIA